MEHQAFVTNMRGSNSTYFFTLKLLSFASLASDFDSQGTQCHHDILRRETSHERRLMMKVSVGFAATHASAATVVICGS